MSRISYEERRLSKCKYRVTFRFWCKYSKIVEKVHETSMLSCANDSWKIQTFLSKDWKIGDSLNELKNRATVISRPHFNKQRNNGTANSDRARNKLLQRSVGNMRRTLIHPRDPARSHGSCVGIYCAAQPGIGKSKCVWRSFLTPFSFPTRSSRCFFPQQYRIFYSTALRSRAVWYCSLIA